MQTVEVTLKWWMDVPDDWERSFIEEGAKGMLEYATGDSEQLDVRQVVVDVKEVPDAYAGRKEDGDEAS